MMFGALICTSLSDKFGRKPIFLISNWAMVIVGVANAFSPNYYVFSVLRFFSGILEEVCIIDYQLLFCRPRLQMQLQNCALQLQTCLRGRQ